MAYGLILQAYMRDKTTSVGTCKYYGGGGGVATVCSVVHVLLTFVDLPGYPDAGFPVGNSIGELVNPGSLMKTSQTVLVVLTLQVATVIMNSRTKFNKQALFNPQSFQH